MSDIFQEVDEDLRREQFARLWKQYGAYFIAACVALVLISAGLVGWRTFRDHQAREASLIFQSIVRSGEEGATVLTPADAAKLEAAEKKLPHGYRLLADMERAASLVAEKKFNEAIALYESVASDGAAPKQLREAATIKSLYLQAEALTFDKVKARVDSLTDPSSGFRFSANELLGYAAYRGGDYKTARDYFEATMVDPAAPQALRQRAEDMFGLTSSRLPAGTAPAPRPAAAPATPNQ